ncbi:MAG: ATP-binding cassette domain-containing protein [Rhizomicrobium sp.]
MSTNALSVTDLDVWLGPRPVLKNISLHAEASEIVALFGHNGAGKSTLLRSIIGATRIAAGRIALGFGTWTASPHALAKLGVSFLPQSQKLFPSMTVRDNLLVYADAVGLDRQAFKDRYRDLARHFVVLNEAESRYAGKLSGGQIQQVAIARALLSNPRLLLLDEPTVGLSPQARSQVLTNLLGRAKEIGATILIAEHRIEETLAIASRAYVLRQGEIVLSGDPAALLADERLLQSIVM